MLAISDLAGKGASAPTGMDDAGTNRSPGARLRGRLLAYYRVIDIYVLFTLCFVLYWLLGEYFGFQPERYIFQLEYPIALYGFFALNRILRPSRFRPLIAALPIFGVYLAHDIHWFVFNDILGFIQVKELPELFIVGGLGLQAVIVGLGASILYVAVRQVQYSLRTLVLSLPYLLLIGTMVYQPLVVMVTVEESVGWISAWLPQDNAARNGRFATALYNEAKRRVAKAKLEGYGENPAQQARYGQMMSFLKGHAKGERQVFLVVLESFLDPRELKPMKGRDDLVDEKFLKYGPYMGHSISPTFVGGTAQAEFELLCGLPAFSEFERTEFNIFTGAPVPCLPEVLGELGYDTVANYPYIPSFFNAQRAYEGMGFREAYFAREHTDQPTYLHLEEKDKYLFDGLLYDQNRGFLAERQGPKKVFNYLLTLYGHLYFDVQRPIIKEIPVKDEFLRRITNITYYRTGPLADYLEWLAKEYPQSLIVAVGDHLPGLEAGGESYNRLEYLGNRNKSFYHTPLLVIENGKPKKLPTINHFGVPYLVYDYLTDGAFCKEFDCPIGHPYDREKLKESYRYLLAQANRDREINADKGAESMLAGTGAPTGVAAPAELSKSKGAAAEGAEESPAINNQGAVRRQREGREVF